MLILKTSPCSMALRRSLFFLKVDGWFMMGDGRFDKADFVVQLIGASTHIRT